MRLFGFRGGVHPEALKQHTADQPIAQMPLPERLYLPLQQHIGAPAQPEVAVGDRIWKGQLLARNQGMISAPIHAPSSGKILEIGEHPAPHPSGLPVRTIVLETDGEDRWGEHPDIPYDPFALSPEEIAARVGSAGIVGMGGATFPSAVKLSQRAQHHIHTLIVNGSECEPYLTCDDRLMQERPESVIDGVRLVRHALQAEVAFIAIEDNKPHAYRAMQGAAEAFSDVRVIQVPSRYPMGWEKSLIRLITGHEVPHGQQSAAMGICVHNVGTAYAVHRTLRTGAPLVSRIVTVAGGAVARPRNVEVPIGTRVEELLAFCGGLNGTPARLLMGGPMMGQVMPHTQVPVVKGSSGILALTAHEIDDGPERPCIRCSRCVSACPMGLMPVELAARLRADDLNGAEAQGVQDCIGCGCCSYVCPAKIPLVQHFNYAKGELLARREARLKADRAKQMAKARQERLARIAAEKEARRQAARAAAEAPSTPPASTRQDHAAVQEEPTP